MPISYACIVLWVFLIGFAVYGALFVGRSQWVRFQASPTVIQLDKNYREWVGTMPAATVCFHNRFDLGWARDYIVRNNLSLETNQTHINDLLELAEVLVSTTAPDLSALTRFAHQRHLLDSVDILQLVGAAHPEYDTDVNSFDPEYNGLPIRQIITERGICYALNAPLASTLQVTNLTGSLKQAAIQESATCTYTKNQCYMKIDTYESTISFYSYNLCVMRCRAAKALELCHCKPHFYPFVDGPTCTVAGLLCLAEQPPGRWYDEKLSCRCLKPCTEIVYILVGTTQNQWRAEGGIPFKQRTSVRWEILQPKTRLLRDVLFSFEDLLEGQALDPEVERWLAEAGTAKNFRRALSS
ncbi:hypothetical protein quinque_002835 [Culex quinquefasciatus]